MKTFFELMVIAATLFIFTACSQSSANETKTNTSNTETVDETVVNTSETMVDDAGVIPKTLMTFASMAHDFGAIEEGDKVSHVFTFTNAGDEPLILNDVKSACGCTVPAWPKEPIAPGGEGQITVEFNSKNKVGNQTKTITINANTDPNPTRLTIKAQVSKVEG